MKREEHHRTKVEGRVLLGKKKYVSLCSCGWISSTQDTEKKADDEGSDHEIYMSGIESDK